MDTDTGTSTNEVLQESDYYPYSLSLYGAWINDVSLDSKYLYNNKETINMKHTKILFEHENALEGGYGIESAWALPVEHDNFQLDNILFYAPEYALSDIVKVENREGELYAIG